MKKGKEAYFTPENIQATAREMLAELDEQIVRRPLPDNKVQITLGQDQAFQTWCFHVQNFQETMIDIPCPLAVLL